MARPLTTHVWIATSPSQDHTIPGLLIAWERRSDGWWGRVVLGRDGDTIITTIPSRLIKPALRSPSKEPVGYSMIDMHRAHEAGRQEAERQARERERRAREQPDG